MANETFFKGKELPNYEVTFGDVATAIRANAFPNDPVNYFMNEGTREQRVTIRFKIYWNQVAEYLALHNGIPGTLEWIGLPINNVRMASIRVTNSKAYEGVDCNLLFAIMEAEFDILFFVY